MSFSRPISQHVPTLTRAFSSTSSCSTAKFSPLHKTTLARAERQAKGLGKAGGVKSDNRMTLEEAAKVLAVSLPAPVVSAAGLLSPSARQADP